MTKYRHWHRLFGITLLDYFSGSNYTVELETDLSLQKQLLDVLILKQPQGRQLDQLPAGLDNLATYNLLTYKSHHEPLDSWALKELVGYYTNYRKQIPVGKYKTLRPESDFQLYAVCTHYPQQLATQFTLTKVQTGVYELACLDSVTRIIVTSQVPRRPHNTLWQLFSGVATHFRYAQQHHQWRDANTSSLINQLYQHYQLEEVFMPYTMADFRRDSKRFLINQVKDNLDTVLEELSPEIVKRLSLEQRLQELTPAQRLKGLTPEQRLKELTPAQRLKGLSPEQRLNGLSPEDFLKRLPLDELEAYLAKVKKPKKAGRRKVSEK
jgi:hypothetical protein